MLPPYKRSPRSAKKLPSQHIQPPQRAEAENVETIRYMVFYELQALVGGTGLRDTGRRTNCPGRPLRQSGSEGIIVYGKQAEMKAI